MMSAFRCTGDPGYSLREFQDDEEGANDLYQPRLGDARHFFWCHPGIREANIRDLMLI